MKLLPTSTVALILAFFALSQPALAGTDVQVERLAGPTRFETAAAAAAATTAATPPAERGAALLARADEFPDGLTAANLGDFPLFLTEQAKLTPATRDAMRVQGVQAVYVVGGVAAISDAVVAQLRSDGMYVERIAGDDRYGTSRATFNQFYSAEGDLPNEVDGQRTVLIASGERFADALAAAPLAAGANLPILLSRSDSLPERTRSAFVGCPNGVCIEQAVILGGTEAVAPAVEQDLISLGIEVRRLSGTTRQATAAAVAEFATEELGWSFGHFNLTRGDRFPDALASGPLGGAERSPTLLTAGPEDLGDATRETLQRHASAIQSFHVLGDETAVSEAVVADARTASTG